MRPSPTTRRAALASILVPLLGWLGATSLQGPEAEPRTADLEALAERVQQQIAELRGVDFERPVRIELATRAVLVEHAEQRTAEMLPPERQAAEELVLKMLGTMPADMDLMAVSLELLADGVAGFYDPSSETMYLMEGFTGDAAALVLAHELTHALDDQLHDIDAGFEARLRSTDALRAYQAVIEGSGMVMMTRWMLEYPDDASPEAMAAGMPGTEALGDLPAVIWKPLFAAYLQGMAFLESGRQIRRRHGQSADMNAVLDQAFLAPPRSTQQVLHPDKYWHPELLDEPREVAHLLDELPGGWRAAYTDTLGELHLALVLEEPRAIDFTNPMAMMSIRYTDPSLAGWDGDQLALLAREDARVLLLAVVFDDAAGRERFQSAFEKARERIERSLAELAGEDTASGLTLLAEGALLRVVAHTGVGSEEALALARRIAVEVGPDPLAGPHDPPANDR